MAVVLTYERPKVEEEQEVRSRGASSAQNTQLTVTQTLSVSRVFLMSSVFLTSAWENVQSSSQPFTSGTVCSNT